MHLRFEPGVVTQVDFGSGPMLEHHDGRIRRAWGDLQITAQVTRGSMATASSASSRLYAITR